MHYRTDVNAVDYGSTTGRSLRDSYALSDQCERRQLHVDHRAFTARPGIYYETNDAFPNQSPHCAATQVWVSVFECGEPVQHPKCQRNITKQLPGNHRDQNVILSSTFVFHWSGVIGNVAKMSFETALCIFDCPACFCQLCSQDAALVNIVRNNLCPFSVASAAIVLLTLTSAALPH